MVLPPSSCRQGGSGAAEVSPVVVNKYASEHTSGFFSSIYLALRALLLLPGLGPAHLPDFVIGS